MDLLNNSDLSKSKEHQTKIEYDKLVIFILVLASSVFFFRIKFLSKNIIYILQFGTICLMIAMIVFQEIYWKAKVEKHHFTAPILVIFIAVLLSMITAYAEHDQSIKVSLWAQRYIYFYSFYFVLHLIKIPINQIEKILFYAGVVYAFAFLIQYILYPYSLFDVRMGIERGTVRIFIPGISLLNLAYFICLKRVFVGENYYNLGWLIFFLAIFLLTGTRSVIAGPLVVTLLSLAFSKGVRSRTLMIGLIILGAGGIVFMFQDIIQNLIFVSEEQSSNATENIRLKAADFFLTEFYPNTLAYFMGNGEPHQASSYGVEVQMYKITHGYYLSDIGIIGEYIRYGAVFILGVSIMLIKGLASAINPKYMYIKHFLLLAIISGIFASTFTSPDGIFVLCCLLYIIDRQKNLHNHTAKRKHPIVYFPEIEEKKLIR